MTTPRFLDRQAAAKYLADRGITVQPETLARWTSNGRYQLPIIKIGRIVRYDVNDLDALIESHKVIPGDGGAP
jgi:hypothetical protein